MKEYQELEHMQPLDSFQSKVPSEMFYLPHHAVFRESSTTTKTRVVFDNSAKASNGQSLNSILATGPVVQQDLFLIIISFRTHSYVLSGDIPKMYRQIGINPQDFPLQRIFWYDNENSSIIPYNLQTVTYGLAPSSFLAIRSLIEISNQNEACFPQACQSIKIFMSMSTFLQGITPQTSCHVVVCQML
ncbi:uncharacterized protein LOC142324673 [Lycorma delicatula]|uniref:uncharacterized protein LOC142324673 n=1 Tax=Lycorma delicatula TaxID=130591 RepID=UPI003F5172CA